MPFLNQNFHLVCSEERQRHNTAHNNNAETVAMLVQGNYVSNFQNQAQAKENNYPNKRMQNK